MPAGWDRYVREVRASLQQWPLDDAASPPPPSDRSYASRRNAMPSSCSFAARLQAAWRP
jgi:hypothetical protein